MIENVTSVKPKRNVKDCVFTNMFGDKKYLIQMYQALHPEDIDTTADDIDIVTLENVLVNDIYNDLGFVVGDRLICLIEAQSTWTMNILIRVILYYSKNLKEYIDKKEIDLYTTKKAVIPKPEFYVVYTGNRKEKPAKINLADEFFKGIDLDLDVTVNMLYGDSDDIIGEYVTFTKVYNEQLKIFGRIEKAITETIRICKDKKVLVEYLKSRETEVIDMFVTLFDEEHIMKAHDKTVHDEGVSQGIIQGNKQKLINLILRKINKGKNLDIIADEVEEDINDIRLIYDTIIANPEKNAEEIYELLQTLN